MKILGIIAEYNPFHNGHAYQLASARQRVMPDYTVAVMSGNFLQRGEPALFDKYTRTKMAVCGGIDAVYELPTYYACSSAEEFAAAAVLTMGQLSVTHLAFGAECDNPDMLKKIAVASVSEDTAFTALLKEGLAAGETYAKAYSAAVCRYMDCPEAATLLSEPNNILAICYLKAIYKYCPDIQPILILRKAASYHDGRITGDIASASAIRQSIISNPENTDEFFRAVPDTTSVNMRFEKKGVMYLTGSDFSSQLRYCFLNMDAKALSGIYDISTELANRMSHMTPAFMTFEQLLKHIKTKKYTNTTISRALIHLLLNMEQDVFDALKRNKYIFYVHLLGFSRQAAPLIKYQREHCSVPWIQKVSDGKQIISDSLFPDKETAASATNPLQQEENPPGLSLFQTDMNASNLYRLVWYEKYGDILPSDYETNALVL